MSPVIRSTTLEAGASATVPSSGGRLVATDGRSLPLRGVEIRGEARGGLARVVLRQRFANAYAEPLRVTYLVPLPADVALAGYAFLIGERRVTGEVDRLAAARERFEEALAEGRSAGIVEQDRPNLFTLELGNVPPGANVSAELTIDQPLGWLDEGRWEWRFPTVVAPRYLGAGGRVSDGERLTVDVTEKGVAVDTEVTLVIKDKLPGAGAPVSPSHDLVVAPVASGLEARMQGAPDRDVVVRWPAAHESPGLALDVARPVAGRPHASAAYGLLTLAPPSPETRPAAAARDLILLIDTSGSMAGEPLAQARTLACALVESLGDADQLELIAFASEPRRWRRAALRATDSARREAVAWLSALEAHGATEMKDAVLEALRPLRADAQRQVVLVTDGLIGFESEIVASLTQSLPAGSRLHTVGVGASVNRGLTAPAARAGRGVEVVVGLSEDVGPHVARLLARMRRPILTEVAISGSALVDHAPHAIPDVYAGAPLRLALKLRPEGGELHVRGLTYTATWAADLVVRPVAAGEGNAAVVTLYGRETVEDMEMRRAAGMSVADQDIEAIGLAFQIATRLTSWLAVSEEPTVDPGQPIRRERIPHALPQGMSVEGLGLRSPRLEMRMTLGANKMLRVGAFTGVERFVSQRLVLKELPVPLVARLVARKDDELTFELDVASDLDWAPGDVKVAWRGSLVPVEIIEQRTTASGRMTAGLTVRLTVRSTTGCPPEPPKRLVMRLAGGPQVLVAVRA
jgi:Ca-activated chloride channel family protein